MRTADHPASHRRMRARRIAGFACVLFLAQAPRAAEPARLSDIARPPSTATAEAKSETAVLSVQLGGASSAVIYGSQSITGTVILDARAPASGVTVMLWSTDSRSAQVPATVLVRAHTDRASFTVTSTAVTTPQRPTISAAVAGGGSKSAITDGTSRTILTGETAAQASAVLDVLPMPQLQSITVTPSPVDGGRPFTLRLAVDRLQPGGVPAPPPPSAALTTDRPQLLKLPQTVPLVSDPTVLSASATQQVSITGSADIPAADVTVTITATFDGKSVSTPLIVRGAPPPIAAFAISPASVPGGESATGTVTMNQALSPTTATITTSHPALVKLPASLQIGRSPQHTFDIATAEVRVSTTITVTLQAGAQTISARLTLVPSKQESD